MEHIMKYAIAVFFFLHGFAHLVGFAGAWRLAKDVPYKTTLLSGRLDVGDAGIRIVGILWLLAALMFALMAVALIVQISWWRTAAICVAAFSLILCVVNLPEAKIGLIIDIVILIFLIASGPLNWFKFPIK
jgi:hypothetical protein